MKTPLFCGLFLFFSLAIFAQDTTSSYFMQMIWLKGDGHVRTILFPNDSLEVSFSADGKDTVQVGMKSGEEYLLPGNTRLIYHDSIICGDFGRKGVWEIRFDLSMGGPKFIGVRIRNKKTGQWTSYKIYCGQPLTFGRRIEPMLCEFENGKTKELNQNCNTAPGMKISRDEAIAIAKRHHYYKDRNPWTVMGIGYNAEKQQWEIVSMKERESFKGECRHCNGCTIWHDRSIVIDATTGKVVSKNRSHGKVKNYE